MLNTNNQDESEMEYRKLAFPSDRVVVIESGARTPIAYSATPFMVSTEKCHVNDSNCASIIP